MAVFLDFLIVQLAASAFRALRSAPRRFPIGVHRPWTHKPLARGLAPIQDDGQA
jgi:hypothetical protein